METTGRPRIIYCSGALARKTNQVIHLRITAHMENIFCQIALSGSKIKASGFVGGCLLNNHSALVCRISNAFEAAQHSVEIQVCVNFLTPDSCEGGASRWLSKSRAELRAKHQGKQV